MTGLTPAEMVFIFFTLMLVCTTILIAIQIKTDSKGKK